MAKAIDGKTGYQQRPFKGLAQHLHAVQQSVSKGHIRQGPQDNRQEWPQPFGPLTTLL
jgi:hypothetical protein